MLKDRAEEVRDSPAGFSEFAQRIRRLVRIQPMKNESLKIVNNEN
ncbi:MAG TPA: hypothetical protein VIW64_03280 [Pyrinomonadaceae bacterium]|jgi:hypothetical protein